MGAGTKRFALMIGLSFGAAVPAGCESVDLGAPPAGLNACRPSQQFFLDEISLNVLEKDHGGRTCSDGGCHDGASGRLFTYIPAGPGTLPLTGPWEANYLSASNQMNCSNVGASLLLTKPTEAVLHGGRRLFEPNAPEAELIRMWVSQP